MDKGSSDAYSHFEEDEIDIFQYITKLVYYWKRFILISVIGAMAGLFYFSMTAKHPASILSFELGMESIGTGKYPDGSVFNKNDVISKPILKSVYKKIESRSDFQVLDDFENLFRIDGIYPLDIQLAKKELEESKKLSPGEIVAKYEKVRDFSPTSYIIHFSPKNEASIELRDMIFKEMIDEYTNQTIRERIPLILLSESSPAFDTSASFFPVVFDTLGGFYTKLISTLSKLEASELMKLEGGGMTGIGLPRLNVSRRHTELLANIQFDLAHLETLIFDNLILRDWEKYRLSLANQVEVLKREIAVLEKKAKFRLKLAEMPTEITKNIEKGLLGAEAKEGPEKSSAMTTSSLIGILLSYNSQYYALMGQATSMTDRKAEKEEKLAVLERRYKKMTAGGAESKPDNGSIKEVESKLLNVQNQLKLVAGDVDVAVENYYKKYEPPVKDYFIVHPQSKLPFKKILLVAILFFFAAMFVQVILISFEQWKDRKATQSG